MLPPATREKKFGKNRCAIFPNKPVAFAGVFAGSRSHLSSEKNLRANEYRARCYVTTKHPLRRASWPLNEGGT